MQLGVTDLLEEEGEEFLSMFLVGVVNQESSVMVRLNLYLNLSCQRNYAFKNSFTQYSKEEERITETVFLLHITGSILILSCFFRQGEGV